MPITLAETQAHAASLGFEVRPTATGYEIVNPQRGAALALPNDLLQVAGMLLALEIAGVSNNTKAKRQ